MASLRPDQVAKLVNACGDTAQAKARCGAFSTGHLAELEEMVNVIAEVLLVNTSADPHKDKRQTKN